MMTGNRLKLLTGLFLPVFLLLPAMVMAQLNRGGVPLSFTYALAPDDRSIVKLTPPDLSSVRSEDEQTPLPYRFAINLPSSIDIRRDGSWTTAGNGSDLWRITIHAPGALAITLYFDRFHLPPEGRFFVYSPDRSRLLGAFTEMNNQETNTFATALVAGDQITLEYNAPAGTAMPELHLSEVAYAYRGVEGPEGGGRTGFGASGLCEVNVKCSEGNEWQNQSRSIARVEVKRGTASVWCTGSLVNNTRNDGTPYLLTADHCGRLSTTQDLSQWVVYFNYQGKTCPNPAVEPSYRAMTGVRLIAHGGGGGNTGSDFFLVRMLNTIPDTFNVYFNGWSRDTIPSPSGSSIHHPQGDIKKISTYTTPLIRSTWNYPYQYTHWKVKWAKTTNGQGVTEGGSSGSPLYDDNGLLVGTLTGGDSACDSLHVDLSDYYGMFYYHWDRNGTDSASVLKYWLDPIQSNVKELNGWALGTGSHPYTTDFVIYPNPVTSLLTVKAAASMNQGLTEINITDLWGNLRLTVGWNPAHEPEKQLDLSGWAPGIYFLTTGDINSHVTRKIIKL